jgi:hypothetical protein
MGSLVTVQFSVALFAGLAAAMIVPPVRRSVPRWLEACIWLGLIVACWMAVTSFEGANARRVTASAAWGADQIVNTSIGLMFAGVFGWMHDHRHVIANAVVTLLGADVLLLILVRSHRKAQELQPRIVLGDWVEFPIHREPAMASAAVPYAMVELNLRAEHATAMLGASILTWVVHLLIWTRDVVIPRARVRQAEAMAAGRVQAAAGVESLRDGAIRLQVSARAWHADHAPAISGLALKAGQALDRVAVGGAGVTEGQLVEVRALLSAQSIGWYGPIVPAPGSGSDRGEAVSEHRAGSDHEAGSDRGEEGQGHESDRLAS